MRNFIPQKQNKKKNGKKQNQKTPNFLQHISIIIFLFLALGIGYSLFAGDEQEVTEVPISTVATEVAAGSVEEIVVSGSDLEITLTNGNLQKSKKESEASLSETLANYGVPAEAIRQVDIAVESESGLGYWLMNILPIALPILFIILFFWFISRQMKGSGMQALNFGQSKAKIVDPRSKDRVAFDDVAGAKEAKEELKEIVDFLKHPKKFLNIGARIPKGVLLTGQPGTGKTLLARAIAGEARVPFFHLSGSEFVEMFVGVGASRVRDLFKMAKKMAPAIVFIDEIDAVGRKRGAGHGGGNDEREQTLNQILTEMDGFEPNDKVIVVAATNRPDVLDHALLRPGRFDRRVIIDMPDRDDRHGILEINAKNKSLAVDVDLYEIAKRTPGLSGADMYSIMNEAAIFAARENKRKIHQKHLTSAIEKVMLGPERKSHLLSEKEKKITAYHEAGHALLASLLPYADPVHKVSIISRGQSGGHTLSLPLEDKRYYSKKEFLDSLVMYLGGYVAEYMTFDDVTTGPSSDLQRATNLIRSMVTKWGMSDKIGPIALENSRGKILLGQGENETEYSEAMSEQIDEEVSRIMNEAHGKAKELLTKHNVVLTEIAQSLLEHEELEQQAYEKIIERHGIVLPHKQTQQEQGDEEE